MTDWKLSAPEIVGLTAEAVDKLLDAGDGKAALLYLSLLRGRYIERSLDNQDAFSKLLKLGLVTSGEALVEAVKPVYSVAEAATDEGFVPVREHLTKLMGRFLINRELETLFGVYKNTGLSPEVLYLLIDYCADNFRQTGKNVRYWVRDIETTAYAWVNANVTDSKSADEYLKSPKPVTATAETKQKPRTTKRTSKPRKQRPAEVHDKDAELARLDRILKNMGDDDN
ncbi:MAG: DnaD domain protein [Oscillospiraceae bacterium]|nr:DnaD domain protein [Oscillospiraceae bacterium]